LDNEFVKRVARAVADEYWAQFQPSCLAQGSEDVFNRLEAEGVAVPDNHLAGR
jgi:hypothetical protein